LLWGFGALALRLGVLFVVARLRHRPFTALDSPASPASTSTDAYADTYTSPAINSSSSKMRG
jgi:hypothetical protein